MSRQLITVNLGEVEMEAIDWLWRGWIPKRYITLLVGETGAGKGTMLSDVIARLTTGQPWPGERPEQARLPSNVIWIGSEDGLADMIKPRLVACGADPNRIAVVRGAWENGQRATFSLQDDIAAITEWLRQSVEAGRRFDAAVIDPITSYLAGGRLKKADFRDPTHMRAILEPWHEVAQEFDLALIGVTHLAKDTTRSMLHRVLGSGAFAQTCRSLPAVIARPDDGKFARALVQIKTNLPDQPDGAWLFRTDVKEIGTDRRGKVIKASYPVWEDVDPELTPESVIGKSPGGPVGRSNSEQADAFAIWLQAQFMGVPPGEWMDLSGLKQSALGANVVTPKWWDENSKLYLDKRNDRGTWMCRLKSE